MSTSDPDSAMAVSAGAAPGRPWVTIEYCPRCGWLLRASWLAQELLTTFATDLAELALIPSAVQGQFRIHVGEQLVWCRKRDAGFPQAAELKRRLRDHVAPGRALGHVDASE